VSTPLLTPLDTPIFDEDVITDIEGRVEDDLNCQHPGCTNAADVRVVMRCCRRYGLVCSTCRDDTEARVEMASAFTEVCCGDCGHEFPRWSHWADIVQELAL
tara:strand:+ start:153 stop:458 length:306 start_codon:yes stop_codon:yes gene_type:complete